MNLACTTALEHGASLKAECPGRGKKVEFSEVAGIRSQRREKIAMATLGTWGLTYRKVIWQKW